MIEHQRIAGRFYYYLFTYVELAGLGLVLEAPTDVFQPSVLVILNARLEIIKELQVVGAPDLVVEVASPGTSTQDRNKKYRVYAKAGVTEYWIVDPGTCTVEVLVLAAGEYRSPGIFRGKATLPSQVVPNLPVCVEQFFPGI